MRKILKPFFIFLTLSVLFPFFSAADVRVGDPAPGFTVMDSHKQLRSLSEFEGKYIVLEWFNPQCPFVRKHYDSGNMQGLQEKYTAQGVVWLSVDSSAEGKQGHLRPEEANRFTEENDVRATAVLLDADGKVGQLYGAKTTPHIFIIDPAGTLVYQGAIDDISSSDPADIPKAQNYVEATLGSAIAGDAVSPFSTKSYGCSVKY